jgi:hypothetical protein
MAPPRFAVLRTIMADPGLRAAAGMSLLLGASGSTLGPYIAQLGVQRFGLGDRGYALLLAASTLVSVSAALFVGIRSDQTGRRRGLALGAAGLLLAGAALMTFLPSTASFVLAHGLILPASSLFGQIFSLARISAAAQPEKLRDGIMAAVRALFALPYVVVLPMWSLAFRSGVPVMAIYPVGLSLTALMLAVALAGWPRDATLARHAAKSGLSLRAALKELTHPAITLRLLALGAIGSTGTVYWSVLSLVMSPAVGRRTADVALFAGLVAGAEVPFMLALPLLSRGMSRPVAMLLGTAIYVVHLLSLPHLAGSPLVWLLVLPASMGGAYILTLPIAYLQDLLADRPGTGSALIALQKLVGDLMAAGCFALGTALSGYALVTALGTAVALTGAVALVLADRGASRS